MAIIASGQILDNISSEYRNYNIEHGLNSSYALNADTNWPRYNLTIIAALKKDFQTDEEVIRELNKHQFEDHHWNWVNKSFHMCSKEYEWFYFIVDNIVQGICNIYHPSPSEVDKEPICYVEYLAVAPWNRDNYVNSRQFKGIGSILLKAVLKFSIETLGYRPGFSLHSLPQSIDYYLRIGMTEFGPDAAKQDLFYFEMEKENSERFLYV